jgi:uncharacterized surface protein with fasciclin (FAS1) repeats
MKKLWMVMSMIVVLALATTGFAAAAPRENNYPNNLLETALAVNGATGAFDTLVAAVTCPAFGSTFTDLLAARGQRTVFAPTDDAFGALGLNEGNICSALPSDTLANILAYHVANGRRDAMSIADSTQIRMLNGQFAAVTVDMGNAYVDGAQVIIPDVMASNGIIHAVNAVLLP